MEEILIQLRVVVIGVAALLVTPILFVALDFWAGIRKAHQRGEKIRSDKMQRTTGGEDTQRQDAAHTPKVIALL